MPVAFDPNKNARNVELRGLSFDLVNSFEWETAVTRVDDRHDYGEVRQIAVGFIAGLIYVLVYTEREGVTRVISLRRANDREVRSYATARPFSDR